MDSKVTRPAYVNTAVQAAIVAIEAQLQERAPGQIGGRTVNRTRRYDVHLNGF
jgi:hypothetical protein